jgi:hypothetical protein
MAHCAAQCITPWHVLIHLKSFHLPGNPVIPHPLSTISTFFFKNARVLHMYGLFSCQCSQALQYNNYLHRICIVLGLEVP